MPIYRIVNKLSGAIVGDCLIDSPDVQLLSTDYQLQTVDQLAQTLDELKTFYSEEINIKAAQVRARYISLYPGQETTYTRKATEAQAYLQAGDPVDTDYPYLNAEATATETTLAALAAAVLQRVQETDNANVSIEAQRKRGVKQVTEAIDAAAVKDARNFAFASLDMHGG